MTKTVKAAGAVLLAAALGGHAVAAPAPAGATPIVVTVDANRIFAECTACKAATAQLQQQGQQLQAYAEQLNAPLRTEGQALQTSVQALNGKQPDAALQQRITAFQTKQDQARQTFTTRQETLQRNQGYARQQIGAKLVQIVNTVMNAHHAVLALDSGAALASAPSTDVTNEVLAQLNAQLPSVSTTAPAAPAAAAGGDGR